MAHPQMLRHQPQEQHHMKPFWRHLWQMVGVMAVGMVGAAVIFAFSVGMTWNQALRLHPIGSLLVVAAGMSIPMGGWMLHMGMGWSNSAEMAAAMALPVIPFLCLVWTGTTTTAQCGAYCLVGIAVMIGLMLYRRDQYSMEMTPRAGRLKSE
jgi:hypothetical protein